MDELCSNVNENSAVEGSSLRLTALHNNVIYFFHLGSNYCHQVLWISAVTHFQFSREDLAQLNFIIYCHSLIDLVSYHFYYLLICLSVPLLLY